MKTLKRIVFISIGSIIAVLADGIWLNSSCSKTYDIISFIGLIIIIILLFIDEYIRINKNN